MDLFDEASRTFPMYDEDPTFPSAVALEALEGYLQEVRPGPKDSKLSQWVNYTAYEKFASAIATKFMCDRVDLLDHREPDSLYLSIGKDESMLWIYDSLKNAIQEHVNHVGQRMLELDPGYKRHLWSEDFPWNEEVFLPFTMKFVFLELAEWQRYKERICFARFEAWYNYKIGKIFVEENQDELSGETYFRGIDLKSPGHKKLCETLTDMGYMFFFEAPCILLGDKKRFRRIDLVVIANNRAVIVEIDGGVHRTPAQQRDDYNRDDLIGRNWTNRIRVEHSDALHKTDSVVTKILSYLDPDKGRIA